jgi:hypothetical protein
MDCQPIWFKYSENLLLKIIYGWNMLKHIGTKNDVKITVSIRNIFAIMLNDRPDTLVTVVA